MREIVTRVGSNPGPCSFPEHASIARAATLDCEANPAAPTPHPKPSMTTPPTSVLSDRSAANPAPGAPTPKLLTPVRAGALDTPNRVWMAPLTRSRAHMPGNIPHELNAAYYAQRAAGPGGLRGAGLIISEATPISPRAHGYYATPGIHTDEQVRGWRLVTDAVHTAHGLIVCQLWHVGRVSHSALQPNNDPPLGPTDVPSRSKTYIDADMTRVEASQPRALRTEEIPEIVEEFRAAAQLAKDAGFDGVEIHGANTYLLDQFTRDGMNLRTDIYGGSLANRLRFPLAVAEAVCDVWGADRVGYRISPLSDHHDARDSNPAATFTELARQLGSLGLAYLHAVETWDRNALDPRIETVIPPIADAFRAASPRAIYVANGDYSADLAERSIARGWCDAVAFGRPFVSNPDLTHRIAQAAHARTSRKHHAEDAPISPQLTPWDQSTFYGIPRGTDGSKGYTDYPAAPD